MNTVVGGVKIKPSDSFHLSIDVARSTAEAEFDSFRMPTAEAWAASKPNQTYDFSQTYLNSDLDTTFFEAGIKGRFQVKEGLSVIGSYRYLDFEDDAPYLGDATGSVDYYGLGLGWSF
jgi:hypothetical protein